MAARKRSSGKSYDRNSSGIWLFSAFKRVWKGVVFPIFLVIAGGILFNLDRLDHVGGQIHRVREILPYSLRKWIPKYENGSAGIPAGTEISGQVIEVHDGDTITLIKEGVKHKIRFYGIDAPEISQNFGTYSRDVLQEKILNRQVKIKVMNVDVYQRLVSKVYLNDQDINREMIAEGMAWYYADYAKNEADYARAEAEARTQRLGLWRDIQPQAPWQYRKVNKQ